MNQEVIQGALRLGRVTRFLPYFRGVGLLQRFYRSVLPEEELYLSVDNFDGDLKLDNLDVRETGGMNVSHRPDFHEKNPRELFCDAIEPGSTVLDVGANIGIYTLLAAKRGARVFAIEADPRNLEMLRHHVQLNGFDDRVTIFPIAVGAEEGEATIYRFRGNWGHSNLFEGTDPVRVPCRTIDSLNLPPIDVCKMDIEGSELSALRGMEDTLERSPRMKLLVEYTETFGASTEMTDYIRARFALVYAIRHCPPPGKRRRTATSGLSVIPTARSNHSWKKMIKREYPSRILITGGHEVGGVSSFAETLAEGFAALGISAEIVSPSRIFARWRELRDPRVLKILSTTAVFAAPFARRAICVAHGFPRPDVQGWIKALGVTASFKVAGWFAQLVAVSYYSAIHLRTIFNLRVDAVIHDPLNDAFLTERKSGREERDCITFAGRLHPSKGLDRILPAMLALLEEHPELRVAIVGDGKVRPLVEAAAQANSRLELVGQVPQSEVRTWLRRTKVFVSGCETEALGIAYLEALSQGCNVVMPACGGGVEIAPELIGTAIHLYSGEGSEPVARALRRALAAAPPKISLAAFSSRAIAHAYLAADSCCVTESILVTEAIP